MKIGLIGLGKMGQAIAYRLLKDKHEVFAYDPFIKKEEAIKNIIDEDLEKQGPIKIDFVSQLEDVAKHTKTIWLMVPAGKTVDEVIEKLRPNLQKESILIDGGNSNYKDTIKRHGELLKSNIAYLDCGTSGGVYGKNIGFCLMIGGEKEIFEKAKPIFKSIATPNGYEYTGPSGSGHYVKMIHNGIEYSLLQAYAEGFDLLKNNNKYKDLDLEKISRVWTHGSVIRSFILDLANKIFQKDQTLDNISGNIGENLTGQWTIQETKEQAIPMDLLEKSLQIREWSRESGGNYATKVVAMLRNEFGGHEVKKIK